MKRILSTLLALTLCAALAVPALAAATFSDVKSNAYYYDPVAWAVKEGITNGTSATTFSPEKTCTRAEIITFLWRAAGSPEPTTAVVFTDVTADRYYAKAAAWAKESGMVDGDTFSPDVPCTRKSAVEFMWKYAGSPDAEQAGFSDVQSAAVNWAVKEGVTNGTSATTFSPDTICTRAQIATFLYRGFADDAQKATATPMPDVSSAGSGYLSEDPDSPFYHKTYEDMERGAKMYGLSVEKYMELFKEMAEMQDRDYQHAIESGIIVY